MMFLCDMIMIRYQNQCSAPIIVESLLIVGNWIVKGPTVPFQSRLFLHLKFMVNNKKTNKVIDVQQPTNLFLNLP